MSHLIEKEDAPDNGLGYRLVDRGQLIGIETYSPFEATDEEPRPLPE